MAYTTDKQPSSYGFSGSGLQNKVFNPTGASAQTNAFSAQCRQIRVANGSSISWIKIDANPTATATDGFMLGVNTVDYIQVMPGQKAAVFASVAGACSVTEMS